MKVIIGDNFGLIKSVDIAKKSVLSKYGEVATNGGIQAIGSLFNTHVLSVVKNNNHFVLDWQSKELLYDEVMNESEDYTSQVIKQDTDSSSASVILAHKSGKIKTLLFDSDLNMNSEETLQIETGKEMNLIRNYSSNKILSVFQNAPLKIFDISKGEVAWKAKNLPHDELDLKVPMWDTDICYEPKTDTNLYTSTAFGEIRQYDTKAKTRPVYLKKIIEKKINRLVLSSCENYLIVGDTVGHIFMLDKRKNFDKVKSIKGSVGAIRDIAQVGSKIISCGLDRFLRVNDYKSYEDIATLYLKHQLNCVYIFDADDEDKEESEEEEDELDDEVDEESESFDENSD